jgi:hypothetical protein
MWLQGADPAAARAPKGAASKGAGATRRCGGRWLRPHASVPRGEREEAAPKGEADPVDPVNPYLSVASDRGGAERPRLRRRYDLAAPVATRCASRHSSLVTAAGAPRRAQTSEGDPTPGDSPPPRKQHHVRRAAPGRECPNRAQRPHSINPDR